MPFNPGGIFTLVASYFATAGTTIRTEQHNPVFEDVASALSSVLIRDGRAPMTGPLNMNGFPINNAVAGSSPGSVATLAQAMPLGAVIDFAGATAPAGWALCSGQAISRTLYASLFALIGTTYGVGDGSTTFNLPDLTGRVTAMKEAVATRLTPTYFGGTSTVLGAVGGLESHALITAQLAAHSHGVTDPGHAHSAPAGGFLVLGGTIVPPSAGSFQATANTNFATTGITINSAGSGDGHNNVQPTFIINKIIRVSYDA